MSQPKPLAQLRPLIEVPTDTAAWLELLRPSAGHILRTQTADGAIPWFTGGGKLDVWNHLEAAMGLAAIGEHRAAAAACTWLLGAQLDNGGWFAEYRHQTPATDRIEPHHVAYIAVAVEYLMRTGYNDRHWLEHMFAATDRALALVIDHQEPSGTFPWALEGGRALDDALFTACCSIYKSLECGLALAERVNQPRPVWRNSREQLGRALHNPDGLFDRHWKSKERFAMNWFYPVLSGALDQQESSARLDARWDELIVPDLGCRCVVEEPWVAVAESCELALALIAADRRPEALALYQQLFQFRDSDGIFWTGYVYPDQCWWPEEQPTWTSGVALMTADALFGLTPAAGLLSSAARGPG